MIVGFLPGKNPASPGIKLGKVPLVLQLAKTTPKGVGYCELVFADIAALLLCCVEIVVCVADEDRLDICLVKSVMCDMCIAEGAVPPVYIKLSLNVKVNTGVGCPSIPSFHKAIQ